jgi:hypothetical protein
MYTIYFINHNLKQQMTIGKIHAQGDAYICAAALNAAARNADGVEYKVVKSGE